MAAADLNRAEALALDFVGLQYDQEGLGIHPFGGLLHRKHFLAAAGTHDDLLGISLIAAPGLQNCGATAADLVGSGVMRFFGGFSEWTIARSLLPHSGK